MMQAPTWTYIPYTIPNFDEVQRELSADFITDMVRNQMVKGSLGDFCYINRSVINDRTPGTQRFLQSIGLLDRWAWVGYIIVKPGCHFPVHVDSTYPQDACYGLNIPVLNATKSYTVFYEVDGYSNNVEKEHDDRVTYATFRDDQIIREIDRVETNQCYWVNVSIPHRPVVEHGNERIICSMRFRPEIHDWFEKHLKKDG